MTESLLILFCYAIILYFSFHLSRKKVGEDSANEIDKKIMAGHKVSMIFMTPSVFNHWTWVTTIIGAAEASILYGISGTISYAFGASIAFAIMILVVVKFSNLMPEGVFITDFIHKRFSEKTRLLFYILSVSIVLYIQVEMAAGLGFVFNGLFGVSFKIVAILSVSFAIVFVAITGIRGILYNDLISFVLIVSIFIVILTTVLNKFDIGFVYERINTRIQSGSDFVPKDFFNVFATGGLRYFIAAIFIGLGQTTIDPSYYLKSHITKDRKTFLRSFIVGGILMFIPISMLSGYIFGITSVALGYDLSTSENDSVLIASQMMLDHFGPTMQILTGSLLLLIVITTIISSSMGILTLAALDIYPNKINPEGSEDDGIRFGKIFMTIIAGIGGLLTISLEKISLLTIDIFCGIVFTAAFSVILMGFVSKKKLGDFAAIAVILGAVSGFLVWILYSQNSFNYLYGILTSFAVPIIFLTLISIFIKDYFNFYSLNKYR